MRLPGLRAILIDGRPYMIFTDARHDRYVLAGLSTGAITDVEGSSSDVDSRIEKMGGRLATASITIGRDYWSNLSENMWVIRDSILSNQHAGIIDADRSESLLDSLADIQRYLMEASSYE